MKKMENPYFKKRLKAIQLKKLFAPNSTIGPFYELQQEKYKEMEKGLEPFASLYAKKIETLCKEATRKREGLRITEGGRWEINE